MSVFKSNIPSSEIIPKEIFLSRRDFIKAAGFVGLGALLAACALGSAAGEVGRVRRRRTSVSVPS